MAQEQAEKVFKSVQINAIRGRDGEFYHTVNWEMGYVQGGGSWLFAAVSRANPRDVVLIPYHAVLAIEVEYEHEQAAIQDTPSA
jgi:hypothetical protein